MDGRPPPSEWHYRSAETLDVDYPQRTIELVVIPYNDQAIVPIDGRMVTEEIAPGAFDGVNKRPNRIRVNRDHQAERTIGKAVAFYPDRPEGLVAKLKISNTLLGEETLELASDENLDASAAFWPMRDGSTWLSRSHVRHTACWLEHIAMTPDPAYQNARVLAVRNQEPVVCSATPNLDLVRSWRLEDLIRSDPALSR